MIWHGKCEICKRKAFFARKRKIEVPLTGSAMSKKQMCSNCYSAILTALSKNK